MVVSLGIRFHSPQTSPGATGNSILRQSSQAQQRSLDISRLSDQSLSDSMFVDQDLEVPSAEQFRAGLRYVAEGMSNDRELSILGVTSTVRKGGATRNIAGGSTSKVMDTADSASVTLTEKSPNVEEKDEGRCRVIEDIAGSQPGPLAESSSRTSPSPEKGFKAPDEAMKSWNIIANANNPRNRTANFVDDFSEDEPSEDEKEVFEMDLGFGKIMKFSL